MGARIDAQVLEPAAGGERLDLRVELACNGKFGKLDRPFASREPVVLDRCQIARFDPEAWELHHDFDVLRRLEADAANGLDESWAGRLLAGLNEVCNVWSEDDRASWARSRAILGELLAHRNGSHVHRAVGDRPRAPGHRLAVAAGRDLPQGRAHVQLADGVHGALPGVPVRLLAGPAVRLDPRAQPRPLRADPPPGRGRALGAGRRHVDRAGLQPAVGRVARPPVPVRTTVLRAGVRPPLQRVLEPRRVRLQRPAAADHARRRDRPVPDPEAVVEPLQPAAAPHVHLAGDRRLARCSRTSRRPTRTTPRWRSPSCAAPRATTRTTTAPAAACWCSAAATAAAGRRRGCSRRCAGWRDLQGVPRTAMTHQRRVLRRAGGRRRGAGRRSSASCTSSTTAARTPPRPLSRRATGRRAGAARRRVPVGGGAAASTRASGWPSSGSCCS